MLQSSAIAWVRNLLTIALQVELSVCSVERRAANASAPDEVALASEKPQCENDDQNNTQDPAEPCAAIAFVCIVSAAATKQQHQDYDEDDELMTAIPGATRPEACTPLVWHFTAIRRPQTAL
jgi:hypothetical protein